MIVHFPIALWPAHTGLHALASWLPTGVAGVAGFWLLAAGTAIGGLAALAGLTDVLALRRAGDECRFDAAINHAVINGSVLLGFTCLCAIEIPRYPAIEHGPGWLAIEVLLLIALGVGNYFGGEVIWGESPQAPLSGPPEPVSKNRAGH
jgi:uncharacterized membrane protein